MRECISWVEINGSVYFLSAKELATEQGKKLAADYLGTGLGFSSAWLARVFYGLPCHYTDAGDHGKSCYCSDFSSASNLPKQIVDAIKNMQFVGLLRPRQLLNEQALQQYDAGEINYISAMCKHEEAYQKAIYKIELEYRNILLLLEDYPTEEVNESKFQKIKRAVNLLHAQAKVPASKKYWSDVRTTEIYYEKLRQDLFWGLFKQPQNRSREWQ